MRATAGRRSGWIQRSLAGTVAGAVVVVSAACTPGDDDPSGILPEVGKQPIPHQSFVSSPDLMPPAVEMTHGEAWEPEYGQSDEFTFLTPNYGSETPSKGAMILDACGELVWLRPSEADDPEDNYFDLRVQEYRGEPALTVYRGTSNEGRGYGEILILDQSYEEIARVTTGGSLRPDTADFHDSTITGDGTMLIGAYVVTPADLSELGGPTEGFIEDAVIQEVDIATGEVLFEWSALGHVPLTETMVDFQDEQSELERDAGQEATAASGEPGGGEPPVLGTEEHPFDYFHLNSITEDDDGSLLVSARHTNAVYRLDRTTGSVDWTLGGSANDFEMGEGATFSWQHDVHRRADGTLTLLDNHAHGGDDDESSRGLRLELDEEAMTAEMVTEYLPSEDRVASSMANAQQLPNGNMLIGWGSRPHYSEYTGEGELIYDVCHGDECLGEQYDGGGGSYRAYKGEWEGRPATEPDVTIQEDDGERVAYVSWNGATEVAQWRLVSGEDEASAIKRATVDRDGFETVIPVPGDTPYTAVEALDENGNVLATGVGG